MMLLEHLEKQGFARPKSRRKSFSGNPLVKSEETNLF
jgi:hypothetical protein